MVDLRGVRVLVTGADGFIGSHLVEALSAGGAAVRALVQYNSFGQCGWLDSLPAPSRSALEIIAGDVRDRGAMREAVQGVGVVFHLAALIAIPHSYRAPESYLATNVGGTLNLLEAARAEGVARFIHTSTSEVYGTARRVPIDEEHPLQAQSPYAASKIAADQFALAWHRSFGLPVTVVRPFNTYGPRQSARAVIPTIITQLAQGATRLQLGALTPTRDFSFVADTVAGFLAAARAERAVGETVNLGSGFEISIGDTARLIAGLMGVRVDIDCAEERLRPPASEVERLYAGIGRAHDLLGWRPAIPGRAGFEAGLTATIAWFRDPANLARTPAGYQT